MKWVLLMWIFDCAGINCAVPDYEIREFPSEANCNLALDFWMKARPKPQKRVYVTDGIKRTVENRKGTHAGVCYQTDTPPKKVEIWRRSS